MSSPDSTSPGGPPPETPPAPPPPKQAGPTNPLNPALLGNVAVLGSFIMALAALIVMTILAVIYDGAYAQALLQITQTIVYASMGVGGATTLAHVVRRQQV